VKNLLLIVFVVIAFILPREYAYAAPCISKIDYRDWSGFLDRIVMKVGQSDRIAHPVLDPPTGSRILVSRRNVSDNEANRVFYHNITPAGLGYLADMKQSLIETAQDPDFKDLCKNTQLAFWLNLHNISVIHAVAVHYPMRNVERFILAEMQNPIMQLGGEAWSIADIERHVVQSWQDPVVIYGFHRGHIGSPNIRKQAYNGKTVWAELRQNAREFTSSLRGIRFYPGRAKLAKFYASVPEAFPNFEADIKAHFQEYAPSKLVSDLYDAPKITVDNRNSTVADLYHGRKLDPRTVSYMPIGLINGIDPLSSLGLSAAHMPASISLPPHTRVFLQSVVDRRIRQLRSAKATVEVEELGKIDN